MLPDRQPLDPDRHTKEPAMPHQGDRRAASPSRFSHGAISRLGRAALTLGLLVPARPGRAAAQAPQSEPAAPAAPASLPDHPPLHPFTLTTHPLPPPPPAP